MMEPFELKELTSRLVKNKYDFIEWILKFHELAVENKVQHEIHRGYLIIRNFACYSYLWIESGFCTIVPPCPSNSAVTSSIPRRYEYTYDKVGDLDIEKRLIDTGLKVMIGRTYA